jgi:hypothetical protein
MAREGWLRTTAYLEFSIFCLSLAYTEGGGDFCLFFFLPFSVEPTITIATTTHSISQSHTHTTRASHSLARERAEDLRVRESVHAERRMDGWVDGMYGVGLYVNIEVVGCGMWECGNVWMRKERGRYTYIHRYIPYLPYLPTKKHPR